MNFDDFASMQIDGQEITELRIDDVLVWEKNTISNDLMLLFTGSNFSIDSASEGLTGQDIVIDWGDGTKTNYTSASDLNHTYSVSGDYSIKISRVTSLEDSCFYNFIGLTSIIIPNNVTSIGGGCFYGCSGLTNVVIPDNITSLGNSCFYNCIGLTSIIIPNNVTSLGSNCFYGCSGLTNVVIPNSVTSLERSCFRLCRGLTNIEIPEGVTNIGADCFRSCSNLTNLICNWESNPPSYNSDWISHTNSSLKFSIPYGTTSIYTDAGYPLDKLEEREGPPTLTLSIEKDIISKYKYYDDGDIEEIASLNVTLTGNDKSNKDIIIKANGTQIDTVQTNNNGLATYSYIPQGNGDIEFTAEYGDLISNSCNIIDAKYYASNETINLAPRYNNNRNLFASDYQIQEGDKIHFRFKNITNHMLWGIGSTAGSDFTFEQVGTTLKYWRNVLNNGSYNNPNFLPNTTEDFVMEYAKYDSTQWKVNIYIGDRYVDYWRCGNSIRKVRIDKCDDSSPSWDVEVFVL